MVRWTRFVVTHRKAVLASWHHLIDLGSLLDGDEYLAGTARTPVARISKATAADLDVAEGDPVTVGTEVGAITLPVAFPKTGIGNSLAQAARIVMSGVTVPAIAAHDGG